MSWIMPLGFLGFLGIAVLILIYILKPNYQQKIISSTHIWKLSLKYRRKRIPINLLRNLLTLLCQILIITACTLLLAQPFHVEPPEESVREQITIIDASANMYAKSDGETRFERAVRQAKSEAQDVIGSGGIYRVILADGAPDEDSWILKGGETLDDALALLDGLLKAEDPAFPDGMRCSYGACDLEATVALIDPYVEENPEIRVLLITGTEYTTNETVSGIEIMDVSHKEINQGYETEWNVAILDCEAYLEENRYVFEITAACYGRDAAIEIECRINGANGGVDGDLVVNVPVQFSMDMEQTIVLYSAEVPPIEGEAVTWEIGTDVHSYTSLLLRVAEADSFEADNTFLLYGGTKEVLNIEYFSTTPETFWRGILMNVRDRWKPEAWDVKLTQVRQGAPVLSGFDVYVFENSMPEELPKDGIVILFNPDIAPKDAGFLLGDRVVSPAESRLPVALGEASPITDLIDPSRFFLGEYTRITMSDGYETLLEIGGDPVLLLKNEPDVKIVVMPFTFQRADLSVVGDFPILVWNLFNYFLPEASDSYVYEVNDVAQLNARGTMLKMTGPVAGSEKDFEEFPAELPLTNYGTYTLQQDLLSGKTLINNFFVKIPSSESDLFRVENSLPSLPPRVKPEPVAVDLYFWFAAAMVGLLFLEWWLQSREYF